MVRGMLRWRGTVSLGNVWGNGDGLLGSTNDEDIPTKHTTSANNEDQVVPSNINQGTLTRSHAKKLQQQVI
jgi:hypothetical protein